MRKFNLFIITSIITLFFCGCSPTKYYEPKNDFVNGNLSYNGSLPSSIKNATLKGAVLKNNQLLSKDGLENIKVEDGDKLINKQNDKFLISNINGKFKVLNRSNKVLFEKDFNSTSVVSASLEGNKLAVVTSNNTIKLIDISQNKELFSDSYDIALAVDLRMADPIFSKDVILYPTLNGKLVIVDKNNPRVLKEFSVSSDIIFNNVLGINFIGQDLYAYTATNLMLISPTTTKDYKAGIKTAIFNNDKIYLFLKDGSVVMLDKNLNELNKTKFKFAIFTDAMIYRNKIYAIEKTGYVFIMDLNLKNQLVYKFDEIDDKTFIREKVGIFYSGDDYIQF